LNIAANHNWHLFCPYIYYYRIEGVMLYDLTKFLCRNLFLGRKWLTYSF